VASRRVGAHAIIISASLYDKNILIGDLMSVSENTHLSLHEIQAQVDRYIGQFKEGYWHPLSMLARVTEEVGELAREINHRFGQKPKKPEEPEQDLGLEIGDILFILVCMANSQGIDLEEKFRQVLSKYEIRDAGRWTRKEEAEAAEAPQPPVLP
jgi:NTP pyrophosphatase (non-canonical NTP hydrolase)